MLYGPGQVAGHFSDERVVSRARPTFTRRIHAATADDAGIAARFDSDAIFYAIRLEPYLVATGRAHPDLAPQLAKLVAATQAMKNKAAQSGHLPCAAA